MYDLVDDEWCYSVVCPACGTTARGRYDLAVQQILDLRYPGSRHWQTDCPGCGQRMWVSGPPADVCNVPDSRKSVSPV